MGLAAEAALVSLVVTGCAKQVHVPLAVGHGEVMALLMVLLLLQKLCRWWMLWVLLLLCCCCCRDWRWSWCAAV